MEHPPEFSSNMSIFGLNVPLCGRRGRPLRVYEEPHEDGCDCDSCERSFCECLGLAGVPSLFVGFLCSINGVRHLVEGDTENGAGALAWGGILGCVGALWIHRVYKFNTRCKPYTAKDYKLSGMFERERLWRIKHGLDTPSDKEPQRYFSPWTDAEIRAYEKYK